jgi:hypothetical protein
MLASRVYREYARDEQRIVTRALRVADTRRVLRNPTNARTVAISVGGRFLLSHQSPRQAQRRVALLAVSPFERAPAAFKQLVASFHLAIRRGS